MYCVAISEMKRKERTAKGNGVAPVVPPHVPSDTFPQARYLGFASSSHPICWKPSKWVKRLWVGQEKRLLHIEWNEWSSRRLLLHPFLLHAAVSPALASGRQSTRGLGALCKVQHSQNGSERVLCAVGSQSALEELTSADTKGCSL